MIHARQRIRPAWAQRVGLALGVMLLTGRPGFALAPLVPLAAPNYSFDSSSPTVGVGIVDADSILTLDHPDPLTAIAGVTLGLGMPSDDLDALSGSNSSVGLDDQFELLFSVDRATLGMAEPEPALLLLGVPYNVLDQAQRRHVAGDQFMSTDRFMRPRLAGDPVPGALANNVLCRNNYDEGGTDFEAVPETHAQDQLPVTPPQDRVDATGQLDQGGPAEPVRRAFFSLTAGSPSLSGLSGVVPPSGATIFRYDSDGPGACCYPDISCAIVQEAGCPDALWMGTGTFCDACAEGVGACCLLDGTCALLTEAECSGGGVMGRWVGPATQCSGCLDPIVEGACCLPDGQCLTTSAAECAGLGGVLEWGVPCAGDENLDGIDDRCRSGIYASYDQLGLQQDDELDALIVFDVDGNGRFDRDDQVLFSLAPGSPSLLSIPGASAFGAAADVFTTSSNGGLAVLVSATELGLGAATDNIDALDFHPTDDPGTLAGSPIQVARHGIRMTPAEVDSFEKLKVVRPLLLEPIRSPEQGRPSPTRDSAVPRPVQAAHQDNTRS